MVIKEPIKCSICGTIVVEDAKDLMWRVLTDDIRCPKCNAIVVAAGPKFFSD
jgi:DNA-directed RNA polymerase subunit RPC12/RpoP